MAEQKCNNCKNYVCSWCARKEPVQGWNATPTKISNGDSKPIDSYAIKDCPEFILNPRAKKKEEVARTAPCCLKCPTKITCKVINGSCKEFRFWQTGEIKSGNCVSDAEVERLWHLGGTIESMSRELMCDHKTISAAKKRLGLEGNMIPKPTYRVLDADGVEIARGTTTECAKQLNISVVTMSRLRSGKSQMNGMRVEAV